MKRKRLRLILIFSSVLLLSFLYLLSISRVSEKQEIETTQSEPILTLTNGERWIQIVRVSREIPQGWYLYDNGDVAGWLEVKTIIEKESLYFATYMGKIHHNRLDY